VLAAATGSSRDTLATILNQNLMKLQSFIILLLFICTTNSFSQNDSIQIPNEIKKREQAEYVSIINLISSPEKYYGKRVNVSGYLSTEFEGTAIYLSREDFENQIYKNSIFLLIGKSSDYQIYHKEFVTLEGTFIKGNGHMGLFAGMIKDIDYMRKRRL